MLIRFNDIVSEFGKPKGIIHIGAHLLEERIDYISNGLDNTIWIEGNNNICNQLYTLFPFNGEEKLFNQVISDTDGEEYIFNITNNGQSSSILELDKHLIHHPHIYVSDKINVKSKRMDTLISENGINISNYDFINLDIQGAELLALKGFGDLLNNFKYIYTEVNTNTLYSNCALVTQIDEYLSLFGFTRVKTIMTEYEWG